MIACTPDAIYTRPLSWLGKDDIAEYGAKNAALGEMIQHMGSAGLWAPQGFAISARGHDRFLEANGVKQWIDELLAALKTDGSNIAEIGTTIRAAILTSDMPADLRQEIVAHYRILMEDVADWPLPVAVLPSIVPSTLQDAAFGGRQPASLFVQTADMLIDAIRKSYAALYTERALAYRLARAVPHDAFSLSIAVQTMVWANTGGRARDMEGDTDDLALVNSLDLPQRHVG
jgi:pyruvate, water dikinase